MHPFLAVEHPVRIFVPEGARYPAWASTCRGIYDLPAGAVRRRKAAEKSPQVQSLEDELGRAIGTRVSIRQGKGKGSIAIEFYSPEDFDRIRKLLTARG
mgnify:CR=1 FL=1